MTDKSDDLYNRLGVDRDADMDAIKKAYRKKAMGAHPDQGGDVETMKALVLAKDILTDDARRARYDATGDATETEPDNDQAKALELILQTLGRVFDECDKGNMDVELIDIIAALKMEITELRAQYQGNADKLEKTAKRLDKMATRFKVKKGKKIKNRLSPMFTRQAEILRKQAEPIIRNIVVIDLALSVLDDYQADRPTMAGFEEAFAAAMGGGWTVLSMPFPGTGA